MTVTYHLSGAQTALLSVAIIWELVWKIVAMWRAARLNQPAWFGLLLIINSVGVLPILYVLAHHERHHPAT